MPGTIRIEVRLRAELRRIVHVVGGDEDDSPVCDEGKDEGDEREAAAEDNDETKHAILVEGGRETPGYAVGDATRRLWEAVHRTRVQRLHVCGLSTE